MSASLHPDSPGRFKATRRGFLGRCPACGRGRLFGRFLKVADSCESCGTALHHHRADDFPPYVVIFIVAHVVGYGIYTIETRFEIAAWTNVAIWLAVGLGLSLALLQPVKGAVVGLQYALGMHGFGGAREDRGVGGEGAEHHGPSHLHAP